MFYFCSMESDAEMTARHGRLLAGYAEQAASLAADLHAQGLAAEAPEEKRAISLAFHRMGRALRQTLALEAKLRRDAKAAARADRAEAEELAKAGREARKGQVNARIAAMIWSEYEPDDSEALDFVERLEAVLDAQAEIEGFEARDLDALVAEICEAIGYAPPAPPQAAPPRAPADPAERRAGAAPVVDHPFRSSA